jgi:hypothetical protein
LVAHYQNSVRYLCVFLPSASLSSTPFIPHISVFVCFLSSAFCTEFLRIGPLCRLSTSRPS